jgi:hypothetical protein
MQGIKCELDTEKSRSSSSSRVVLVVVVVEGEVVVVQVVEVVGLIQFHHRQFKT